MGKHASDIDKAAFLVHLQYVHQAEAARRAGLSSSTASDIKFRAGEVQIQNAEQGLPPPTLAEQVARKEGSRAKKKISDEDVLYLFKAYILNKKQKQKLWYIIAYEEGFFNLYYHIIKKKLRAQGLCHYKLIKKLHLTKFSKGIII